MIVRIIVNSIGLSVYTHTKLTHTLIILSLNEFTFIILLTFQGEDELRLFTFTFSKLVASKANKNNQLEDEVKTPSLIHRNIAHL